MIFKNIWRNINWKCKYVKVYIALSPDKIYQNNISMASSAMSCFQLSAVVLKRVSTRDCNLFNQKIIFPWISTEKFIELFMKIYSIFTHFCIKLISCCDNPCDICVTWVKNMVEMKEKFINFLIFFFFFLKLLFSKIIYLWRAKVMYYSHHTISILAHLAYRLWAELIKLFRWK